MRRENILLISYDFPPALAGVRRIVKFAKFLPEFGYDPVVLAATPDPVAAKDYEIEREVRKANYPVYRTPSLDVNHIYGFLAAIPREYRRIKERLLSYLDETRSIVDESRWREEIPAVTDSEDRREGGRHIGRGLARSLRRALYLPDDRVGWLPFAYPQAVRILESLPVRYILTTSYPNSTHLLGAILKRRYKVIWIADFRDGWTTNPYFADYPTPLHRKLNARWETRVAREADLLLAVSEPIAAHLRTLTPHPGKVRVIPNGFDPDDFIDLPVMRFERFTLVYTGTLFGQRSPEPLFAAMRILFDKHPHISREFQAIFLTKWQPEHERMIESYRLREQVVCHGIQPYRVALQFQRNAHALVAIEGPARHGEMMLTQKVFEYLACGKPILAITPENALAQLVRQTRTGFVVHPDDISQLVERLYDLFMGVTDFAPRTDLIRKYQRREQTRELASLLDQLRRQQR